MPVDSLSLEIHRRRAVMIDSKLAHATASIKAYPLRAQAIRMIRLEPSNGIDGQRARALVDFLKLYSTRITHLAVLPLPASPSLRLREDVRCHTFHSFLDSPELPFPKLQRLQ